AKVGPLKAPKDVLQLVAATIADLRGGRLDNKTAATVGTLAANLLRSMELTDLEQRLAALEAAQQAAQPQNGAGRGGGGGGGGRGGEGLVSGPGPWERRRRDGNRGRGVRDARRRLARLEAAAGCPGARCPKCGAGLPAPPALFTLPVQDTFEILRRLPPEE